MYTVKWVTLTDLDIEMFKTILNGVKEYDSDNESVSKVEEVVYCWVKDTFRGMNLGLQQNNMKKLYGGLKDVFNFKGKIYRGLQGENLEDIDEEELVSYTSSLGVALEFNRFLDVKNALLCDDKEDGITYYGVDVDSLNINYMLFMLIEKEVSSSLDLASLISYIIENSENDYIVDTLIEYVNEDEIISYDSNSVYWYTYSDLEDMISKKELHL